MNKNYFGALQFPIVLIDEGGQIRMSENFMPLINGAERVVLVGDHKQLKPFWKAQNIETSYPGFEISLLERLVNQGFPSIMLDIQYRMHPYLARFSSVNFYFGKLKSGIIKSQRNLNIDFTKLFPSTSRSPHDIFINGD